MYFKSNITWSGWRAINEEATWGLLKRNSHTQFTVWLFTPLLMSFINSFKWITLSKALLKSRKQASTLIHQGGNIECLFALLTESRCASWSRICVGVGSACYSSPGSWLAGLSQCVRVNCWLHVWDSLVNNYLVLFVVLFKYWTTSWVLQVCGVVGCVYWSLVSLC